MEIRQDDGRSERNDKHNLSQCKRRERWGINEVLLAVSHTNQNEKSDEIENSEEK